VEPGRGEGPPTWVLPLSRALVASFLALNVVLIALRRDLSVRDDGISSYLVGDLRWLGVLSFVLLSAGGALLAVAVRSSWEPLRGALSVLLFVYSSGVLLAGLTHPDSPAHQVAAFAAFAAIPVATLVSSTRLRILWFVVITASFLAWPILHFGAGERVTVLLELAWLLWLGWKRAMP
jgi:hypothetical protein